MNKSIGDTGEKIAKNYLEAKGYKILDKNFRYSKLGELDLVAQKGAEVIFFEVKARMRKGLSEFKPEDNITQTKQKKLVKLAQIWLAKHPAAVGDTGWQIDILAIEIYRDKSFDIRHLENAIGDFY
jgi:putative endonuclease